MACQVCTGAFFTLLRKFNKGPRGTGLAALLASGLFGLIHVLLLGLPGGETGYVQCVGYGVCGAFLSMGSDHAPSYTASRSPAVNSTDFKLRDYPDLSCVDLSGAFLMDAKLPDSYPETERPLAVRPAMSAEDAAASRRRLTGN